MVVGAGACAVAALPGLPTWVVLGLAMLWGVAGSLMVLVTLHMATNFIGHNTVSVWATGGGGIVYNSVEGVCSTK